ncbi:hypothetical protein [Pedobacter sp. Leaf176]|uniref:hypothetical protein n=1 Tax=Pedobacter sp. Leaf176 TaxID=1736286 RepID=UPI000ACB9301|nr:hypothetical protein [Pedobacter sp. Leaf176]
MFKLISLRWTNPILLIFITTLYGCGSGEFKIIALDKDLNAELMSLKNIDLKLLGTNRTVQYFKVSGSDKLSPEVIKSRLFTFTDGIYPKTLPPEVTQINLLFYRDRYNDYPKAQLYHAAMETEEGIIEKEKHNLIAFTRLLKSNNGKWVRIYNGYSPQSNVLTATDTLMVAVKQQKQKVPGQKLEALVEDGNCLKVVSGDNRLVINKCYEVNFLRIRQADEKKLSLTFISGKNAIDVDFYPSSSGWVSKKITFFGATTGSKKGITQNRVVNLREFDFSTATDSLL